MNRSLSPLKAYGRNFVCFPIVLRGTGGGFGNDVEVVSGPPGAQVSFDPVSGRYFVGLPGEGRFSHISVAGNATTAGGGAVVLVSDMSLDPFGRQFSFQLVDYSGAAPVVFQLQTDEVVSFIVIVDNK